MPHAPDLSGTALDGRYELHAVIGEGTFGRVYRGLDRRLARRVAVKVIKPWWAEDPNWVRSFEREAQLLASVNDPGIVQIFDVGSAPEGLYYVAEMVDGESLVDRLRDGPARAGRGVRDRRAARPGAGQRPRPSRRPSRRQARERADDRRRPDQGGGLRRRAARRGQQRRGRRHDRRHAALHGSRAGSRRGDHAGHRRVRARCRALRDAGRPRALRGRLRRRARLPPRPRHAAAAARDHAARARSRRRARAGQGPCRPLPGRRRDGRRAPGRRGRRAAALGRWNAPGPAVETSSLLRGPPDLQAGSRRRSDPGRPTTTRPDAT